MPSKRAPEPEPEASGLQNKMFRLTPEAIQAFDILKAKSGSRSGPRLAAEMIDLLLIEHGEKPVGPLRPGAAAKRQAGKPKPGS
jgi:hypothetical protein